MTYILSFLWFIRTIKAILFWLYLWQLKEYHIGRFLDHFSTEKGKKLFFNKLVCLKSIYLLFIFSVLIIFPLFLSADFLIILFFSIGVFAFIIVIIYFVETANTIKIFLKNQLKRPVITKKTVFLALSALILVYLFIFNIFPLELDVYLFSWELYFNWDFYFFILWLLVFDIFTPLVVSLIVLIFQPIAVLGRSQIIRKAIKKREQFKDLLVIGITGSYGKTSTKEFLYTILAEKFGENRVLKTKEHQNSEVGVSQCILNDLKPGHEIFIVEMGAYNRGGIKLLSDIAKPKIGILTGINEQHLATFGSQENIIRGKYELIENLPPDGIAFFNAKNKYCVELYQKTFQHGLEKTYLYGKESKFFGEENLSGAIAVAKELGITDEEISKATEKIENKLAGIKQKKGISGLIIFDATYSANPNSVIGHLEYLSLQFPQAKKIIVMPCLIELGSASKEVHKRIGEKIGEVCNLAIITTKDRFKEIVEGAGEKAIFLDNPKEIFEKIKEYTKEGDIILLESRVPKRLINLLYV